MPVPVPARGRAINNSDDGDDDDYDDEEVVDPSEFQALSRSLTTGGHFLQPEPLESAMLRPNPNPGIHRQDGEASYTDDEEEEEEEDVDVPNEESPLIHRRHSIAGRSIASTATNGTTASSPFLNGTSTTRFWFIFSQILAAYFISCFDGTIMASSHPVITSYFGASNSASWLSTAFLLTSSAFQPLLGRLSDAVGRKPLFVACLGVFAAATAWCALAGSIEAFILGRALCGLGAGGVMTLGSIIVSDLVPIE